MNNGNTKRILLWIVGIAAIVLVLWGMYAVASKGLGNEAQVIPTEILGSVTPADHAKGKLDGKVTIIEYSDFECPACASYYPAFKALAEEYKDKVRFIYRHFPLQKHKNAELASLASEAAAAQGKFWEMHDKLFEGHDSWVNKTDSAKETFLGYAKDLKLDMTRFTTDLSSTTALQRIKDSYLAGIKFGVDRTPSIFVNDNRVIKFDLIKATIDAELAKNK